MDGHVPPRTDAMTYAAATPHVHQRANLARRFARPGFLVAMRVFPVPLAWLTGGRRAGVRDRRQVGRRRVNDPAPAWED